MQLTTNYGFKKPESTDPYNINDITESFDIIDRELKTASNKADTVTDHPSDMNNPHQTTAAQVGLGNVPNVATNDQTPTYTVATTNVELSSGEKLSVAFGKIAKAISSLISHLADATIHFTTAERTKLSGIATGANAYTHPNSGVTAGTYRSVTVNVLGHVTAGTNPVVSVAQGGTGATTATAALTNLGTVAVIVSTTAPTDTTAVWVVPN